VRFDLGCLRLSQSARAPPIRGKVNVYFVLEHYLCHEEGILISPLGFRQQKLPVRAAVTHCRDHFDGHFEELILER
jgi:hypothetical protein